MPDLWRISNHRSLSGEGGLKYSARWHSAGHRIVYLAESPAGALIEVLVHLELDEADLPPAYTLLRVTVPNGIATTSLKTPRGNAWKSDLTVTRSLGDQWLSQGETALARVPSAILPKTMNLLLNPMHADAQQLTIAEAIPASFDSRLLAKLRA